MGSFGTPSRSCQQRAFRPIERRSGTDLACCDDERAPRLRAVHASARHRTRSSRSTASSVIASARRAGDDIARRLAPSRARALRAAGAQPKALLGGGAHRCTCAARGDRRAADLVRDLGCFARSRGARAQRRGLRSVEIRDTRRARSDDAAARGPADRAVRDRRRAGGLRRDVRVVGRAGRGWLLQRALRPTGGARSLRRGRRAAARRHRMRVGLLPRRAHRPGCPSRRRRRERAAAHEGPCPCRPRHRARRARPRTSAARCSTTRRSTAR